MARTVAMILAGGEGSRLSVLTAKRAKPSVPFAGRYRIIDFVLSNLVHSNIFDIGVMTQYRPRSLEDHIGNGRPWDLDRSLRGGVRILQPYLGRSDSDWYAGTADAVQQNFDFIRHHSPELVVILAGDHIYKMDYQVLIEFHRAHQADVTVATVRVPPDETSRYGILETDQDYSIMGFEEKPLVARGNLASMGIYVFNTDVLSTILREDSRMKDSRRDFGSDILPRMIGRYRAFAFPFGGYWVDVGTVKAYWETHMDLLQDQPPLNLLDRNWIIYTRSEQRPPVDLRSGATAANCLITDGCVVAGTIEDSVLGPGVRVMAGAIIRQSVIMNDTIIQPHAVVERAIVDKQVVIGQGAQVGSSGSGLTDEPLVVIGKNTRLPAGVQVRPGAIIAADLAEADFPKRIVGAGKMARLMAEATS